MFTQVAAAAWATFVSKETNLVGQGIKRTIFNKLLIFRAQTCNHQLTPLSGKEARCRSGEEIEHSIPNLILNKDKIYPRFGTSVGPKKLTRIPSAAITIAKTYVQKY